ncbi:TIGR04372 family glycosyltransferase [Candidatus Pacearchaeota archaeon]|nr:TIGR04372 family glycosyltransferase [Candidatus Pacearchaeota archaeon]
MILEKHIFGVKRKLARFLNLIATNVFGPIFWKMGIIFLSRYYGSATRIGETAHQLDLYVKMSALGWGPSHRGILLARKEKTANLCLMKYWSNYIHVISNPFLFYLLFPLAELTQYDIGRLKMPDGKVVNRHYAIIAVQNKWDEEGRSPLLVLSSSHRERGWNCLQQLGIPRGSWFVCLHVREAGFLKEGNNPYHAYRNADINTYLLAVKTIVEAGGWVIRMGDSTMKPLPPLDHVIDYANSEFKSDWMDIFCCAECRFFLGTTSGLFIVSFDFGVPCALANDTPMGDRPWSKKDRFIPKLYWSTSEGRYLTFEEALAPKFRCCYDGNIFESSGISVIDNTPEEISDIVLEMLNRLDNNLEYTEDDDILQDRFNTLLPYKKYGIGSRVGGAFLRKYEWLLPKLNNEEV